MLDYIGGEIIEIKGTRSGSRVILQVQFHKDAPSSPCSFHVRGKPPGQCGERLVVMLLQNDVVGWHNQATGAQGWLLQLRIQSLWNVYVAPIALTVGLALGWAGKPLLGWSGGIGWLLSRVLARGYAVWHARGELAEALRLAAGVTRAKE